MYRMSTLVIGSDIPALVAGHDQLHVVFASDKAVEDHYKNGPVETNKHGLTIQLQNYNLKYPFLVDPPLDGPLLLVVYGGVSGFDDAVELAEKAKEERPDCQIILATCACDQSYKHRIAAALLESGVLAGMVQMKYSCHSDKLMRQIFDDVLESWPVPVSK